MPLFNLLSDQLMLNNSLIQIKDLNQLVNLKLKLKDFFFFFFFILPCGIFVVHHHQIKLYIWKVRVASDITHVSV